MSRAAAAPLPAGLVPPGDFHTAAGKLGMWVFLFSDAMMFAAIVVTYAMLRSLDPAWPDPKTRLDINLTGVFTFVLICSSVTMVMGLLAAQEGNLAGARKYVALTILGGAGFLGFQTFEWTHFLGHGSGPRTDLFYATFFTLTGFHGFHVLSGLGVLGWMIWKSRGVPFVPVRVPEPSGRPPGTHTGTGTDTPAVEEYARLLECGALYWHFVDLVWIVLFTAIYLL